MGDAEEAGENAHGRAAAADATADDHVPAWLEAAFEELNRTHFAATLTRPYIALYKTPGTTAAATVPTEDGIVVFIGPRLIEQDRRWARDTLLHEMIHVALLDENGDGDAAHGERFTGYANRIGATMGLAEVQPGSRDAMCWPQGNRSETYPPWVGDDCPIPRSVELAEAEELVVELPIPLSEAAAETEELVVYDEDA